MGNQREVQPTRDDQGVKAETKQVAYLAHKHIYAKVEQLPHLTPTGLTQIERRLRVCYFYQNPVKDERENADDQRNRGTAFDAVPQVQHPKKQDGLNDRGAGAHEIVQVETLKAAEIGAQDLAGQCDHEAGSQQQQHTYKQ